MDNMEASYVIYISRIIMVTLRHHVIVSVIFIEYPGDYLRQTSAGILSLNLQPINI
jgi:hypothetical protein